MRGWVYIITNRAMPDLLKIGFTLKDPNQRAKELGRTGLPYPYIVEYEIFTMQPRQVEKKVHTVLENVREGREWFRCSIQEAVAAIRRNVGDCGMMESVRNSEFYDEKEGEPGYLDKTFDEEHTENEIFQRTTSYEAACENCGTQFKVTLTRYDSGARCPNCHRMNSVSASRRQRVYQAPKS